MVTNKTHDEFLEEVNEAAREPTLPEKTQDALNVLPVTICPLTEKDKDKLAKELVEESQRDGEIEDVLHEMEESN